MSYSVSRNATGCSFLFLFFYTSDNPPNSTLCGYLGLGLALSGWSSGTNPRLSALSCHVSKCPVTWHLAGLAINLMTFWLTNSTHCKKKASFFLEEHRSVTEDYKSASDLHLEQ